MVRKSDARTQLHVHVIVINATAPIDMVKNKLFEPSRFE